MNEPTLREKQSRFVEMVGHLILKAYELGYEMTFGDAWAKTGHSQNSKHYVRLAIDLNLFKDGKWLSDGSGHDELHDYWDQIGGGERIPGDLNHYDL